MSDVRCHHGYLPKRCTVPDCENFICADLYGAARTARDTIATAPIPLASKQKLDAAVAEYLEQLFDSSNYGSLEELQGALSDWAADLRSGAASILDYALAVETRGKLSDGAVGPVPHGFRYDVKGWICSVCGGWNNVKDNVCAHSHLKADACRFGLDKRCAFYPACACGHAEKTPVTPCVVCVGNPPGDTQ